MHIYEYIFVNLKIKLLILKFKSENIVFNF